MVDWASIIIDGVSNTEVTEHLSQPAHCQPVDPTTEGLLDQLGVRVEYVETPGAAAEAVANQAKG